MTEETTKPVSTNTSASRGSTKGVPAAIVVAGGLIAVAIYFGGKAPVQPVAEQPAAVEKNDEAQVAGVEVGDIRAIGGEDHIRGAENAKVTIVEYSDLECPFCKRFHETMRQVMDEYPNDVRWVYRHFPLEQLHSKAKKEAEAVECAGEQGKFWEMLDLVFETTPANNGLDLASLPTLAGQAGVPNVSQFSTCLESGKYAERVEADLADAAVAGGRGTPYSVIIGADGSKTPFSGAQPLEKLKAAIEEQL